MKIKFSHNYEKLREAGQKAILIAAIPYHIDDTTPKEFLRYDTQYATGYYQLKPGGLCTAALSGRFRIVHYDQTAQGALWGQAGILFCAHRRRVRNRHKGGRKWGMIDQIMKMISGETELDNVIQKAMISGDTDRALEDNGEAYFKYDKEENSFSVKVIGSVFFIGHTAGRLIGQFYEAQKRNGTWDEKAKKQVCNLLSWRHHIHAP